MREANHRVIVLGLASVLLFAVFCAPIAATATAESATPQTAAGAGPYEFTFTFGWDLAQGAIPPDKDHEDPHFKYVLDRIGVAPLTQPYDWNGGVGYEQQVRLQLSGGQIPEAMQVFSEAFVSELIAMGVLLPLDDLLPVHAPATWAKLSQDDLDLIRSFSPDRKIYFVPNKLTEPRVGLIRKDWLDRVGITKVPSTVDELLAAYKAFKERDANGNGDPNDEIPVSGREYLRWLDDLFVMWGVSMLEGNPQWRWHADQRQFISDQVSDEMRNAIEFIRKLYAEGYMDHDMPVLPGGDWFAKIQRDVVGHYFHTISGMERRLAVRNPGPNGEPPLNALAQFVYMPNVAVPGVPHQPNYAPGLGMDMAITTEARDPGRILKWYDWQWTEEGTLYKWFGIEGVNYKKNAQGKIYFDNTVKPISNKFPFMYRSGDRNRAIYEQLPQGDQMAAVYDASVDDVQYIQNKFMPISVYEGYEDYKPETTSILYREVASKMIIGELPMSAWDSYVEEWYAKGGRIVTERATKWYMQVHNIR